MTAPITGRTALLLAATAAALALVGCAAEETADSPAPSPVATPDAMPVETPEPSAPAPEFRMPATCSEAVPGDRAAAFSADGLVLLAGPDGLYGDAYLADPTPEQQAGGITCIWGDEESPERSVTISVAPVTAATRTWIVDGLVAQALNVVEQGDLRIYTRIGDPVAAPAIVNLVRPDSWISVITGLGGEEQHLRAVGIAEEVSIRVGASAP